MTTVRSVLTNFVDKQMGQGDLVAIVRVVGGVGFLQQFIINRMTREDGEPPPDAKGAKKKPPPKKLSPAEA